MNLMGWNEILMYIINVVFKLLVVAVIPYLFNLARVKMKNDTEVKYLNRFEKMVEDAVNEVQQTYVENMKAVDLFNSDAQVNAFNMVKTNVANMMNDEMQAIVYDAVGDFDEYIRSKIEARVYKMKQEGMFGIVESATEADA